jgi:hypothetical protein
MLNLFKRKPKEAPFNIHHPDMADKIEFAFECGPTFGKRKFYRFKAADNESNEFDQRTGRYIWIEGYLRSSSRKMDDKTLLAFIDEIEKNISGEQGKINLVKASVHLESMRALTKLQFEPELVKRLASVVFFDETEDLRTYSRQYGEEKIRFWEKYDTVMAFFFVDAYRRVMWCQRFISRIFAEIHSGEKSDDNGHGLQHPDAILGQFIKDQELEIKLVADNNPTNEEVIRKWSRYEYLMHILSLKRKADALKDPQ